MGCCFSRVGAVKVQQEGIRVLGAWYMHELLAGYVGEAVLIRYDPQVNVSCRVEL